MLLVTHTDLDGIACSMLHKMAFGHEAKVEYVNYDAIDDVLLRILKDCPEESPDKPGTLLITDISPSEVVRERIGYLLNWANESKRMRIRLFDHHKSSLSLKQYEWVNHRMDVCGAQIYYDWLVENNFLCRSDGVGNLIHLIDLWDRRVAGDPLFPRAKDLEALFRFFRRDSFINRCLATLPTDVLSEHKDVIAAMQHKEEDVILSIIKKKAVAEITDFQGKKVALFILSSDGSVSNVCDRILQEYPQADYAAAILPGANIISLRSRDDGPDIEVVAKTFGGGGHPHASGFPIDTRELLFQLIGEMFECGTKECKTQSLGSNASEQ